MTGRHEMDTRMQGYIDQYGWGVQGVFGEKPEEMFHYTVGLHGKGLPELWVGTLAPSQAQPLLNQIARLLVDAGEPPADDQTIDVGWSIAFRLRGPVDFTASEAFTARRLAGEEPLVMQVLWPDSEGRWPDKASAAYDSGHYPQRVLPLVTP
jgi:hypothetical protein